MKLSIWKYFSKILNRYFDHCEGFSQNYRRWRPFTAIPSICNQRCLGHPIIFVLNIFPNSYLIHKCIQNQQLLLILYTFLNQMRVGKTFNTTMIRWPHFSKDFSTCNVWCIKIRTKDSSKTLLSLVRFLMHQNLTSIVSSLFVSWGYLTHQIKITVF